MSLLNVVIFGVGAILVYSAVKNKNPKDVVNEALSSQSSTKVKGSSTTTVQPKTQPAIYQTPYIVTSV